MEFMLQGKLQKNSGEVIDFSKNIFNSGMGYWLVFHKQILTQKDIEKYRKKLKETYDNLDVKMFLLRYDVSYIVAEKIPDLKNVKIVEISTINELKIFKIYE